VVFRHMNVKANPVFRNTKTGSHMGEWKC